MLLLLRTANPAVQYDEMWYYRLFAEVWTVVVIRMRRRMKTIGRVTIGIVRLRYPH